MARIGRGPSAESGRSAPQLLIASGALDPDKRVVIGVLLGASLEPLVDGVNTNRIGGDLKINVPLQAPDFSSIYVKKS